MPRLDWTVAFEEGKIEGAERVHRVVVDTGEGHTLIRWVDDETLEGLRKQVLDILEVTTFNREHE